MRGNIKERLTEGQSPCDVFDKRIANLPKIPLCLDNIKEKLVFLLFFTRFFVTLHTTNPNSVSTKKLY